MDKIGVSVDRKTLNDLREVLPGRRFISLFNKFLENEYHQGEIDEYLEERKRKFTYATSFAFSEEALKTIDHIIKYLKINAEIDIKRSVVVRHAMTQFSLAMIEADPKPSEVATERKQVQIYATKGIKDRLKKCVTNQDLDIEFFFKHNYQEPRSIPSKHFEPDDIIRVRLDGEAAKRLDQIKESQNVGYTWIMVDVIEAYIESKYEEDKVNLHEALQSYEEKYKLPRLKDDVKEYIEKRKNLV